MIKIFTNAEIDALYRYTVQHDGIPLLTLIENTARKFAEEFLHRYKYSGRPIVCFAGFGNNGADALALSLELANQGLSLTVVLLQGPNELTEECCTFKERVSKVRNITFVEVIKGDVSLPKLTPKHIVIDGIFGTGLNAFTSGPYKSVIAYINQSCADVISIDVPSGLFASYTPKDSDKKGIIRATETYTIEYLKLCFFFAENEQFIGTPSVIHIGLSTNGKEDLPAQHYLIDENYISTLFNKRKRFAHKGHFGHGLLVAGSQGKMGAAVLAARGALRSGIGKLTCHIPYRGEVVLQTAVPEAMLQLDSESSFSSRVITPRHYDAVAVGPGIGCEEETVSMLEVLFEECAEKPLVVDADAINIIAQHRGLLDSIPKETILTPHAGEFDRLTTQWDNDELRLESASKYACDFNLNIVLKGAYTAVCSPNGAIYFSDKGNPGMATAGSGDVLTGIILSLLAQGYAPTTAAVLACSFHGQAGDLYAARSGETSLIASDIIDNLPQAFKGIER